MALNESLSSPSHYSQVKGMSSNAFASICLPSLWKGPCPTLCDLEEVTDQGLQHPHCRGKHGINSRALCPPGPVWGAERVQGWLCGLEQV